VINYVSVKIDSSKKITEALFFICKGVVLEAKAQITDFISRHQNFGPHYNIKIAKNIPHKCSRIQIFGNNWNRSKVCYLRSYYRRMLTVPQCRICSFFNSYKKIKVMIKQYVVTSQYTVLREMEET